LFTALVTLTTITALVCIVMLALLLNRTPRDAPGEFQRTGVREDSVREAVAAELARFRQESRGSALELRQEIYGAIDALGAKLMLAYESAANADRERLEHLQAQLDTARQSIAAALRSADDAVLLRLDEIGKSQQAQIQALTAFVADSLNRLRDDRHQP
jgi:hypothetical protein